jgi:hypothetical protein
MVADLAADGWHVQDIGRKKTLTQPSPASGRGLIRPVWWRLLRAPS